MRPRRSLALVAPVGGGIVLALTVAGCNSSSPASSSAMK